LSGIRDPNPPYLWIRRSPRREAGPVAFRITDPGPRQQSPASPSSLAELPMLARDGTQLSLFRCFFGGE